MALNKKITDWSKQRVWVVGASTGIGAALADQLHSLKAKVAISARSADKLNEMVTRFGASRAMALPLDITQVETIQAAEKELVDAWGGYDLVIFMAGDYTAMRAWELDLAVAKRMIDVNLGGFMNGLSVVIPRFMKLARAGLRWYQAWQAIVAYPKVWSMARPRPR
jgi:NADP-dependent 3-hydroxy acid dehydrogenase YdfG